MKIMIALLSSQPVLGIFLILLAVSIGGCKLRLMPAILSGAQSGPECIYVQNSSAMLRLSLPVVEYPNSNPVFRDSVKHFAFQRCNGRHVRAFVRESESPVIVMANITLMSVEGDICGPAPKFVMYDQSPRHLYNIYGQPTAPWKPMGGRVVSAIAVTKKRCGVIPNEMQFVARQVVPLSHNVHWQAANGKLDQAPFQYTDFFSARMFPYKNATLLISDNPDLEDAYWREQHKLLLDRERKEELRRSTWSIGSLVFFLPFLGSICEKDGIERLCLP